MTYAWRIATGDNIPLVINGPPGLVAIIDPAFLRISGGAAGEVLTSDGAGGTEWGAGGGGGGGGIADAPDAQLYVRQNGAWVLLAIDGGQW